MLFVRACSFVRPFVRSIGRSFVRTRLIDLAQHAVGRAMRVALLTFFLALASSSFSSFSSLRYWRVVTASFAHFDLMHLGFNLMSLYNLMALEVLSSMRDDGRRNVQWGFQ